MRASFMQVPHDLFRTTALGLNDKMVLLAIIDVGRSDMPNRWNTLPIEKMVEHTGMSRAGCYRSIKNLTDLGVIQWEKPRLKAHQFQVQWDALDALVEAARVVSSVSHRDESVSHRDDFVSHRDGSVSHRDEAPPSTRGDAGQYKSKRRSTKEKSVQQPSSPRSNEWDDTCFLCSQFVAAGEGRLIGSEAAHHPGDCPSQAEWD